MKLSGNFENISGKLEKEDERELGKSGNLTTEKQIMDFIALV